MLKKIFAVSLCFSGFLHSNAQTDSTKSKQVISGSLDAYYRYNFADPAGKLNNYTSFTNSQNSFELGMASLKIDHSIGKVSATVDLGFGRRAQEFSYNDANSVFSLKQAYLSWAVSDKFKLTAGKWATHVGYELVDASGNRNYSMSYGFSYGPFFHTGVKADLSLGGKSALMVGIASPTDFTTTTSPNKVFIAQFSTATKDDKLKAYLNYQGGKTENKSGFSQFDLVLLGTISSKFAINYNATIANVKTIGTVSSWSSNAVYLNFDPNSKLGFTLRGEYFDDKKSASSGAFGSRVFATTLSANLKVGPLTFIPEIRVDNGNKAIFFKSNGAVTKSTSGFLIAAVYKF